MSTAISLLVVAILVLLNGFFVAAEFALVSVRRSRIDQLVNNGSGQARVVQRALAHLDTYIAATQLGITMASLGLGFVGEPAIGALIHPLAARFLPEEGVAFTSHSLSIVIAFSIATALHIVFGELAPKSIALQRPEQTSLWVTAPLNIFVKVFRPFIYVLNGIGNFVVRLMGFKPVSGHASVHSVEELELLVKSSREAGVVDEQQEYMVAGVFEFAGRHASQIMTPRTEIEAMPVTVSLGELARRAGEGSHSRLPIYDGDLDHIVGVVHVKDVLRRLHHDEHHDDDGVPFDVREIMRKVLFVAEGLPLDRLMAQLRHARLHFAVVIDEFGGTAGLVTFEDLLEEIVGDVADEFDSGREQMTEHPDGSADIDGLLSVEEVNDRFELGIEEDFYDSIGGHVFGKLQRPPEVGDEVELEDGRCLRVVELDERRIARLFLTALPLPGEDDEDEEG
ncbi:MAG TPA: hemolysin family protein [Rhodothermales bacterium]|nr:hemolysin family protein [Rhodothermales bacterium]